MPDVQEVFRMATQKVGPEPGALDRQLTRQRRSGGARKMGAFAVAASFIALAVAVFALTRTSSGDSTQVASQPPAVPVPTTPGLYTVNVATGSLQSFPDPGGTGFTTSPDGSKIAFWSDLDGSQQLFVMNADGSDVQQVTDDPYGAESRRGRRTARSSPTSASGTGPGGNIFVLDLASGESTRVTDLQSEPFEPSWSPDGQIAYTLLGDRHIRLIDPATGKGSVLLTDPVSAWNAQWSPDGNQVAYVHEGVIANAIWVMDADGSGKRELVQSVKVGVDPAVVGRRHEDRVRGHRERRHPDPRGRPRDR